MNLKLVRTIAEKNCIEWHGRGTVVQCYYYCVPICRHGGTGPVGLFGQANF